MFSQAVPGLASRAELIHQDRHAGREQWRFRCLEPRVVAPYDCENKKAGRTMTYGDRIGGYRPAAKLLHWLVAVCVLTTAPVAIAMGRVSPGPAQDALYNFHKSLGVLILILMILRLINRLAVGAPIADPGIEPWQKTVSSIVHTSLYVLLLAMPIVGYIANSVYG